MLKNKPDLLRFYSQQTQVLFSLELYGVQNIMSVPNLKKTQFVLTNQHITSCPVSGNLDVLN